MSFHVNYTNQNIVKAKLLLNYIKIEYVEKQDLKNFKSDNDVSSNMQFCKLSYENAFYQSIEHAYQHAIFF